jgi:hypothetical protein
MARRDGFDAVAPLGNVESWGLAGRFRSEGSGSPRVIPMARREGFDAVGLRPT